MKLLKTPKLIAASAYPSSASSQFGASPTKASRLHPLLAFVFAGLASTLATSTQAHYTLQTLAGTTTEKRTEQTASGTNRLPSYSDTENPRRPVSAQVQWCGNDSSSGRGSNPSCKLNLLSN